MEDQMPQVTCKCGNKLSVPKADAKKVFNECSECKKLKKHETRVEKVIKESIHSEINIEAPEVEISEVQEEEPVSGYRKRKN